jgi:hypothetical protein
MSNTCGMDKVETVQNLLHVALHVSWCDVLAAAVQHTLISFESNGCIADLSVHSQLAQADSVCAAEACNEAIHECLICDAVFTHQGALQRHSLQHLPVMSTVTFDGWGDGIPLQDSRRGQH